MNNLLVNRRDEDKRSTPTNMLLKTMLTHNTKRKPMIKKRKTAREYYIHHRQTHPILRFLTHSLAVSHSHTISNF